MAEQPRLIIPAYFENIHDAQSAEQYRPYSFDPLYWGLTSPYIFPTFWLTTIGLVTANFIFSIYP